MIHFFYLFLSSTTTATATATTTTTTTNITQKNQLIFDVSTLPRVDSV